MSIPPNDLTPRLLAFDPEDHSGNLVLPQQKESWKEYLGRNGKKIGFTLYGLTIGTGLAGGFIFWHCKHVTCSDPVNDTGEALIVIAGVSFVAARVFLKMNGNYVERRGPQRT